MCQVFAEAVKLKKHRKNTRFLSNKQWFLMTYFLEYLFLFPLFWRNKHSNNLDEVYFIIMIIIIILPLIWINATVIVIKNQNTNWNPK